MRRVRHAGLARARGSDDRERSRVRRDRVELEGVEIGEQRVAHVRTVHTGCATRRSRSPTGPTGRPPERGKTPSSLRCVGSSDLLGAFPPEPDPPGRPRRRPPNRPAGPCAFPKVCARPGPHVRPFRPRKRFRSPTHRRTGESAHYDRAARWSRGICPGISTVDVRGIVEAARRDLGRNWSTRLRARCSRSIHRTRALVSHGRGIDGGHGDRARSRDPQAQTRRGGAGR